MTRPRTEDDLLEFKRLVRWLAGVTLTQADAEKELAALEARYAPAPATPTEPEPDWIRWTGGKNPAPGKTVRVKFWPNHIAADPHPSDELFWNHHSAGDRSGDIVAYRVVSQ